MGRSESSAPSIRPICSGTAVVKSWGNLAVKSCLLTCVAFSTALWGQAPDSNQSGATPDPPATTASPVQPNQTTRDARSDDTYIIGDDDVLAVSVWNEANISKEIPVRSDGKISLPLVGEVLAAGRTPPQLEQEIATRLRGFITDPQVTVIVEQMNSQKFNIFGQVGTAKSASGGPSRNSLAPHRFTESKRCGAQRSLNFRRANHRCYPSTLSRRIHSRTYGGQLRNSIFRSWQSRRNRTDGKSTSLHLCQIEDHDAHSIFDTLPEFLDTTGADPPDETQDHPRPVGFCFNSKH